MIELSHVYKSYPGPVHAIRDLSLKIDKGDLVFLAGASGSGKTTLFRLLYGTETLSSGNIKLFDQNLDSIKRKDLKTLRSKMGIVFQDFRLIEDQTVFDNIALPLKIRGERSQLIKRRVHEALEDVGLRNVSEQQPNSLSGGEQQRVAIARSLIHRPALLIADEPTGNLDRQNADGILELFFKAHARGTTLVIATHDEKIYQNSHGRRIRIENGGVVEQ